MPKELSAKDAKKRELILNGSIWQTLLVLGAPLALFNGLNLFFKLYDTLLASTISPMSVSVVSYLSQLNLMFTALGGGFAIGCSIKISEAYGSGDYALVHKRVQLLFAFAGLLSAVVLCMIPFTSQFLKLTGTPEEFINSGTIYFALHLLDNVLVLFNTAYIAIERSRGNSTRILALNVGSMVVKMGLNTVFVLIMGYGIEMMAVATICSNSVVFFGGFIYQLCLKDRNGVFAVNFKEMKYESQAAKPMLKTSVPVVGEKVAFQLGKVAINGMCGVYGNLMVGALGVSNNISSMTMAPINGFQEAGIAMVSQNRGAGNEKRALKIFYTLLTMNLCAGVVGYMTSMHFLPVISSWFDSGDPEFNALICLTYFYEVNALIPLAINSAVMALLYGHGYTKLTLLINFSRVLVFRVPVLWYMQQVLNMGSESIGIVMMISNGATGIIAIIVTFFVVRKIKKENNL
ncbi:MAG: MATE family efflux transporter [Eubacteriales bacterium]